jgi:8-oxo-dGTP pyrophosphatase MutT (NUDIX family)
MPQSYKIFINNRPFSIVSDAGAAANVPGTLVVNYDSADSLLLMIELAHSEEKFFGHVIILHNDPSRVFHKIESLTKVIEAAGGAVKNSEGRLLMIHRRGKWDLPKGKIDKGETAEKAAVREVEEECGVTGLQIVRSLSPTYHTYKEKEKLFLKKTYWYEMLTSDTRPLVPQTEEGIDKCEWRDAGGVGEALKDTFLSVIEVVTELNSR